MAKLTINKNEKQRELTGGITKKELLEKLKEAKNSKNIEISPEEIKTGKPFEDMFKINQEILKAVTDDMVDNGYDNTKPIIIWKEKDILIDGHTRKLAASEVGLKTIPAIYVSFVSEKEALYYAQALQFNRRNLSDADLISFIKTIDINNLPGKGNKDERLRRLCSIGLTKAKNLLKVIREATAKQKNSIESGEATINQIYAKVRIKLKSNKTQTGNIVKKDEHQIINKNAVKEVINEKSSILVNKSDESIKFYVSDGSNVKYNNNYQIPLNEFDNVMDELLDILNKYKEKDI